MNPILRDVIKNIFAKSGIINSRLYKIYTMKKVKSYVGRNPSGSMGVAIETILSCNAKCEMCYHNIKNLHGIMTMKLFRKIIDDCKRNKIDYITMNVYGEPLLDPNFIERVKYLRKHGMSYRFSTNGSLMTKEKSIELIELGGLREVIFSVMGYDKKVYKKMMGLDKDNTYKNILDFISLNKETSVMISIVKTNINKDDIKDFVKFWRGQDVDRVRISDLWDRVGEKDITEIGELNELHRKGSWLSPCRQVWEKVYIYYDGRVSPCCNDADLRELIIGNINNQTLKEIYGGKIIGLRKMHLEDKRKQHPICGKCPDHCVW